LEQPLAELMGQVHVKAATHFLFAKATLPLLKDAQESSYLFITGAAGGPYSGRDGRYPACLLAFSVPQAPPRLLAVLRACVHPSIYMSAFARM
jgi:hypothetical protein